MFFNLNHRFYVLFLFVIFLVIIPECISGYNRISISNANSSLDELANEKSYLLYDFIEKPTIFKSYGPLFIDMNNIKYKNSIFFVPILNDQSKPLILAIYCDKYLINVKGSNGWKGWKESLYSFEDDLTSKLCGSFD